MTHQPDRVAQVVAVKSALPTCSDLDMDCNDIADKVHCWLYDPAKGMCPFLRAIEAGEPFKETPDE